MANYAYFSVSRNYEHLGYPCENNIPEKLSGDIDIDLRGLNLPDKKLGHGVNFRRLVGLSLLCTKTNNHLLFMWLAI